MVQSEGQSASTKTELVTHPDLREKNEKNALNVSKLCIL